ncbi:MAG: hypothetical protein LBT55_02775 [Clostridiaceae bacterium]|nr:hypothetical protein [Clostridiaceae bacterium]
MLISVITLAFAGAYLAANSDGIAFGGAQDGMVYYYRSGTTVYTDGSDIGKNLLFMAHIDAKRFKADYKNQSFYVVTDDSGRYELKITELSGGGSDKTYTQIGTLVTGADGVKSFVPDTADETISASFDGTYVRIIVKTSVGHIDHKFTPLP